MRVGGRPNTTNFRAAQTGLDLELDMIIVLGWQGAGVTLDEKTREPIIQLSIQTPSPESRWCLNHGLIPFPPHPNEIAGFKVRVEARPIAYLGGPPPSLFQRLLTKMLRLKGV